MKEEYLLRLADRQSAVEVMRNIRALCARFGTVTKVDWVPGAEGYAYCLVELAESEGRFDVLRELGGTCFGSAIMFTIPPPR